MNEPVVVQPLDREDFDEATDSMNVELFRCGISDDTVRRSGMNDETVGVKGGNLCSVGIQTKSCRIIFSSADFTNEQDIRPSPVQISPMSIKETDAASEAFLAELSLKLKPDLLSARRSGPPKIRRKQRPNPVFSSSESGPFPIGSTQSSGAVAAVEAILGVDPEHYSSGAASPQQPPPRKRKSSEDSSEMEASSEPLFDQVSTRRPYSPGPSCRLAAGSPSSYTRHQPSVGPHDVPTESPQDFFQEDFIGMPRESVADVPTDNALVMPPGIPNGISMESPACFPTESPTRCAAVFGVGLPTDFIMALPSLADMSEDLAVGVLPPHTKSRPKSAGRNIVKAVPARKARVPYPRAHSLPNTLEAQYWRQPTSRRYYPRGQGPPPPPPPPVASLKIPDPFKPRARQRSGVKSTARPDSRYRRGHGLAPMPYSLPSIPTQPPSKKANTRRFSMPTDYRSAPPHPWQQE